MLGRDLFVRVAQGLRVSLLMAAVAAVMSTVLSVLVGILAAATGGWVDKIVMRVVDATNTLPHLLLGVVIASLWRGQWWAIALSIGLTHWTQVARIVRSEILSVRRREHVLAAVAAGASRTQVIARHLVPSVVPQALIAVVLLLPHAVARERALVPRRRAAAERPLTGNAAGGCAVRHPGRRLVAAGLPGRDADHHLPGHRRHRRSIAGPADAAARRRGRPENGMQPPPGTPSSLVDPEPGVCAWHLRAGTACAATPLSRFAGGHQVACLPPAAA